LLTKKKELVNYSALQYIGQEACYSAFCAVYRVPHYSALQYTGQ